MMNSKKRCGRGDSSPKQLCHRPLFLLAVVLILGPAGAGGQTPAADSLKTASVDQCGNPKTVNQALQDRTVSSQTQRAADQLEKFIAQDNRGTAYFFLGSLCPCTDAHKHSIMELMSLAPKKGIKLVAVFPNKGESAELVEHFFKGIGFKMDYIIDSTNRWVRKFDARKTPQVFLVSPKGRVVYAGPVDDSVENLGQVKNAYLKNAVLDLSAGRPVAVPRAEGSGCWIVRNR